LERKNISIFFLLLFLFVFCYFFTFILEKKVFSHFLVIFYFVFLIIQFLDIFKSKIKDCQS